MYMRFNDLPYIGNFMLLFMAIGIIKYESIMIPTAYNLFSN